MKPTGLKALLPELNEAQYKLLERWAAEQQAQAIADWELVKHGNHVDPFMQGLNDTSTDLSNEIIKGSDRIATLKKEAGL